MPEPTEMNLGNPKIEHSVTTTPETEIPDSFDDMVVGGSLAPVKVRISPGRTRREPSLPDDLLIELQCEV